MNTGGEEGEDEDDDGLVLGGAGYGMAGVPGMGAGTQGIGDEMDEFNQLMINEQEALAMGYPKGMPQI